MKIPFSDLLPFGVCDFSEVSKFLVNCSAKSRIPENAKSVIVYLFPYYLGEEFYKNSNISKYAVPQDYHLVLKKYLEKAAEELKEQNPDNEFQWFCDNSPLPEVYSAVLAGVGVKGENGLLINEKYGSFVFIGEIITDLSLPKSKKSTESCLKCGICKRICPGEALDGSFDKEKCFSHLTQKKGELSEDVKNHIKASGCIWGCDVCQNDCPMNRNIQITPIKEFLETARSMYVAGDSIENRAFAWRGKDVIERNLKIMCCKDESNEL